MCYLKKNILKREGGGDVNLPISQKIGLYVYLEE